MKKFFLSIYYFIWVPLNHFGTFVALSFITIFLLIVVAVSFGLNIFMGNDIFKSYPADLYAIENWKPQDNTKIYDRDGKLIAEKFTEYHHYISFSKIPKKMINAIIAIEDRKFWDHPGLDIFAIFRAGTSYLNKSSGEITQGASTITQQVIKNMVLTNEKTFTRKIREVVLSLYLETFVSKERILEIYCNSLFLGNGAYGVGAAAKRYFGKDISQLDYHETALIAGLFQSPGKYNPVNNPKLAKERQLQVLDALTENKVISKIDSEKFALKNLNYQEYESSYGKVAPYFVDYIMDTAKKLLEDKVDSIKNSGLRIITTLNSKLDRHGQDTLLESDDIISKMNKNIIYDNKPAENGVDPVQASLLVLDRNSGEILTMIGGVDYSKSKFNRAIQSLRAPGSVFKTFIYTLGLDKGLNWNRQYYVSPITVGNYRPHTQYSQLFSETTLFESFYKSINSTAVLLGQEVGLDNVLNYVKLIGVETPLKEEASTFLGGSEVSLMDMGRAYLTIANKGLVKKISSIIRIENSKSEILYQNLNNKHLEKRILQKTSYDLIEEGLRAVVKYGTGYKLRHLDGKVAGKTGTSNQARDNWFCGYTKDLVIITWMGNDDQNSFGGNISASQTAGLLWSRFAAKSISELKTGWLPRSNFLLSRVVHPKYGHLTQEGVKMYFLPGNEPKQEKSDLYLLEQGKKIRLGMNEF